MAQEEIQAVAVYTDNNFGSELSVFKPMRCNVGKSSRLTMSPIETGQKSIDNKVIEPIEVEIVGYVNCANGDDSGIAKINAMFMNRKFEFYSVTTREGAYDNLILQNAPHDEDVDRFDQVKYTLKFVEAMFIQGRQKGTSTSDNSKFVNSGYRQARKKKVLK